MATSTATATSSLVTMELLLTTLRSATDEQLAEFRTVIGRGSIPTKSAGSVTSRFTKKPDPIGAPDLPEGPDEPSAEDYRMDEDDIEDDKCLGRVLLNPDKRWSPMIYSEAQCGRDVDEDGLCTTCLNRFKKYQSKPGKDAHWEGRVTEDPLPWHHMLGTSWAITKKAEGGLKWLTGIVASAGSGASDSSSISSSSSSKMSAAELRSAAKALAEKEKAEKKEKEKAEKEAAKAAAKAIKDAEAAMKKAAEKAAKEEEKAKKEKEKADKKAAEKAAKEEEKAKKESKKESKKDSKKDSKSSTTAAPAKTTSTSTAAASAGEMRCIDGEMFFVKGKKVYEYDFPTESAGSFIGILKSETEIDRTVSESDAEDSDSD